MSSNPPLQPRIRWVEHGEKTRWSNFWVMVNTNRAEAEETSRSHVVVTLRKIIDQIFSNNQTTREIFRVLDENGLEITDSSTRNQELNKIEDIQSEAVVEIGSRQHRIHSHILIQVQHRTRVQINVPVLRDLIRKFSIEPGETQPMFPNPAVKLRWIKNNPIHAIQRYQRGQKGPTKPLVSLPPGIVTALARKV